MARIDQVVDRILTRRTEVPENRSLLVGISALMAAAKAISPAKSKRICRNAQSRRQSSMSMVG